MIAHCLFEQSGTFKNEFKSLGIEAIDYDILDDFGQTDKVLDLFAEIEGGYSNKPSIFDDIHEDDLIMAFFPCIRFEDQAVMLFLGNNNSTMRWSDEKKLSYDLKLHDELHTLYSMVTKLAIISYKRKIPTIIENPYSTQHYLQRYWPIKPKLIDKNRSLRGDYYRKPTQYWFLNCDPKYNFLLEPMIINEKPKRADLANKVERSLISKEYANRFIREFIL